MQTTQDLQETMRLLPTLDTLAGSEALQPDAYRLTFDDAEFISRRQVCGIRFQLELLKPELGMEQERIHHTIVVYGPILR